MKQKRFLYPAVVFVFMFRMMGVFAQEATLGEAPATSSVDGQRGPFAKALEKAIAAEALLPRLKLELEKRSPFFNDTRIIINTRTYYFDRENRSLGTKTADFLTSRI